MHGSDAESSPAADPTFSDTDQRIAELEARLQELRQEYEAEISELKTRLNEMESQDGSGDPSDHPHTLATYAAMPDDERDELLSPNKRRAAKVYNHWNDVAWTMGDADNRRQGVDTATRANAKHNPAKIRRKLSTLLDEDLVWNDVYRTMRQIAKLSGGDELVDDYDRTHIAGGEFEYHEKSTADGQDMKRVLYRSDAWNTGGGG